MSVIKVLPDSVSNKIAAGEVIERPASVVKELVENSIDAGAARIKVKIEKAGKKLIAVSDDGCGMDPDDAVLSLEPHATSKIRNEKDITGIITMGFRGEALPSIASVSKLKLRTRQEASTAGTELIVNGGRFVAENPIGCAPGTEIIVSELFFNIPARKKFLKTDSTEEKHITETICSLALANYRTSFELIIDGRIVINTPGAQEMLPRICDFLGRTIGDRLLFVNGINGDLKVSGYVSKPSLLRNSRREQRIFINKRPIKTVIGYSAIGEAYDTMIMKGSFPIAVLYLDIPPDKVDINVHPAKQEARFQNPNLVKGLIRESIAKALQKAIRPRGAVKTMNVPFSSILTNAEVDYSSKIKEKSEHKELSLFNFEIDADVDAVDILPVQNQEVKNNNSEDKLADKVECSNKPVELASSFECTRVRENVADKISLPGCDSISFIGIIDNTYLLCSSEEGLIVVDQHAAHERIIFERLLANSDVEAVSQRLLLPITVELTPPEYIFLIKKIDMFNNLGFEIEDFGTNTVIITALPNAFSMNNISEMISDMIDSILQDNKPNSVDEHIIAGKACKFAVKANDVLSKIEAEKLLKDLSKCKLPFSCPHGRPTVINISYNELEKRFGRKV